MRLLWAVGTFGQNVPNLFEKSAKNTVVQGRPYEASQAKDRIVVYMLRCKVMKNIKLYSSFWT